MLECQLDSDSLLNSSSGFWLAEFDRLVEMKERMEKSEERFNLGFSEKLEKIESQIAVAAGHMGVELSLLKKERERWDKIEESIYES